MAQSTVRLIVDAQNAIRPLQRTDQITRNLSRNTDKLKGRLDKANRSFHSVGRGAKTASAGVNTLVASLRPLLTALALIGTAIFIFVKTAELQTQRIALVQLTGSVEKTNKIIKELQAFGNVTPFTSSELITQAKRLKAFGFETENLVDMVKRLSDVAGATGADLSGISTAFGQIFAKGKLQREEELQLLERGVDITSELKRITGTSGEEFESMMRKGQISSELVLQALKNLTNEGGVFFGGATKQSQTLNGQISTLVDNVETLARTIGDALEPSLMAVLKLANKSLAAINRLLSSDFQRQISGFRLNLITPGGLKSDLEKIEDFTKNIQPLGLDTDAIDLRISQLQGTSEQITKITNKINKGGVLNRPFFTTESENTQILETQEAITQKINELTERKNALLTVTSEKTTNISNGLKNNKTDADKLAESFGKIGDTIATGISDALIDAINGTKTLGESLRNIVNELATSFLRLGINSMLKNTGSKLFANLPGFANGGKPPVNKPSIVGERGPEVFVPSIAGNIIANDKLGGSTNNVVVNVDASGSSIESDTASSEQLGRLIGAAIQSELIKEKRPGGLLS